MPQTNIVFVRADQAIGEAFDARLAERGIVVSGRYGQQRWVTHKDLDDEAIATALAVVEDFFAAV